MTLSADNASRSPVEHVPSTRNSRSTRITLTICAAGVVELSGLGLFPGYGVKPVGDVLLLLAMLEIAMKGKLSPRLGPWATGAYAAAVAFILYAFGLMLYTAVTTGSLTDSVVYGRRWLIAGAYFLIVSSKASDLLDKRLVLRALQVAGLATVGVYLALRLGVHLPGAISVAQYQGGIVVDKVFLPGDFLLMINWLVAVYRWMSRPKVVGLVVVVMWLVAFLTIDAFRSWWFAAFIALAAVWFVSGFASKAKILWSAIYVTALTLAVLVAVYAYDVSFAAVVNQRLLWLASAFNSVVNLQGDALVRYLQAEYLLSHTWAHSGVAMVFGSGYASGGGTGTVLTATNDSGWLEVAATGGILSGAILALFWTSTVVVAIRRKETIAMVAMVIAMLLMVTSNPLLWDFGFVPIAWVMLWNRELT